VQGPPTQKKYSANRSVSNNKIGTAKKSLTGSAKPVYKLRKLFVQILYNFCNKRERMIFTPEKETKRVIFNVDLTLARRLDQAKKEARSLGKRLDVDEAVNAALEDFLKRAEKSLAELTQKQMKDEEDMNFIRIGPDLDRSD
jgi:hypothetical protein